MAIKGLSEEFKFSEAVPVWEKGCENAMNRSLVFRCTVKGNEEIKLFAAASSRYQIFVDGVFYAAGPARAAHGFYRVSEYTLKNELSAKETVISIIATGYNVNSFYLLDTSSFLCAEIQRNGQVLFATGKDGENGFETAKYLSRLEKTPRYSFQRPFTECYIIDAFYDEFMKNPAIHSTSVETAIQPPKKFIKKNSPYCVYSQKKAQNIHSKGILIPDKDRRYFTDRCMNVSDKLKGFPKDELDSDPANELYAYKTQIMEEDTYAMESVSLGINCCCIYDMGQNNTGYIRLSLTAEHDTVIYAVFNEILPDGICPDPGKDGCQNVVKWAIQGGRTYDLVTFEPYTFRYIQIISMYAPTLVTNVSVYEECYPENAIIRKKMPDAELQAIYDAAVSTFRQNATDIFSDCPSRERAGWLCDSYFTARVENELTKQNYIEHDFLENFILPEKFDNIPNGMLPMCYPADHYDGTFIHNWAFWFVLQLKEYFDRTNDEELVFAAKDKVYALMDFSEKYENADGLLQNTDSWIFIEWSKANDFVRDISYPSNMLYAAALESAAKLYSDNALHEKSEKIKTVIREKAFDGEFFVDNAVLDENKIPHNTNNKSETNQYYAFFTKTATKQTHPKLYETMLNKFGPSRDTKKVYPDIPESNAFIGNFLRLSVLFENGEYEKSEDEIRKFFLPMAQKTGTLWENMTDSASCCHGFASHVAFWLNKIADCSSDNNNN